MSDSGVERAAPIVAGCTIDLPADNAFRLECLRLARIEENGGHTEAVVARASAYAAFVLDYAAPAIGAGNE